MCSSATNKLLPSTIQHYHYFSYYDIPLEGMLRANGSYWYFKEIPQTTEYFWGYVVLKLPDSVKRQYLKKIQNHRHKYGWYRDRNSKIYYPASKNYRNINDSIPDYEYEYPQLDECPVVGFTVDLKDVYFR